VLLYGIIVIGDLKNIEHMVLLPERTDIHVSGR